MALVTSPLALGKYWQGGKLRELPVLRRNVRRRVDMMANPHDALVKLLGECGFSNKAIMGRTHYSESQIMYRLKKGNVSRQNYRDGKSPYALRILNAAPMVVLPLLQEGLAKEHKQLQHKNGKMKK